MALREIGFVGFEVLSPIKNKSLGTRWCPGPDSNRYGQSRRILPATTVFTARIRAFDRSPKPWPVSRTPRLRLFVVSVVSTDECVLWSGLSLCPMPIRVAAARERQSAAPAPTLPLFEEHRHLGRGRLVSTLSRKIQSSPSLTREADAGGLSSGSPSAKPVKGSPNLTPVHLRVSPQGTLTSPLRLPDFATRALEKAKRDRASNREMEAEVGIEPAYTALQAAA